ncbi:MAG: hypothetical protein ABWY00_13510 [Dongiaceae bacterium]
MRGIVLTVAAFGTAFLLGGCASDTSGAGNLFFDNNCSGNGVTNSGRCESLHPVAGPWGDEYRDSSWHQFDDQAWLNVE